MKFRQLLDERKDISVDDIKVKKFSGTYYHQTGKGQSENILKNGFIIMSGGNQRFSEGVYLSNHPNAQYGDVTLKVNVSGMYMDLTHDMFGDTWNEFKNLYMQGSFTTLTKNLKKQYPKAQGVMFHNKGMLVVWDTKTIKKVELK